MSYLAPNFTQLPNLLLEEHIKTMAEAEMRVALAIARKTFGWHKRQDKLSLSQLMDLTGMSRQGVINGIEAGIARGIIRRERDGQGYLYELVILEEPVNEVDQCSSSETSQRSRPALVNEVDQLEAKTSQRSRPALVNEVDQLEAKTSQRSRHTKESIFKEKERKGDRARLESNAVPTQPPAPPPATLPGTEALQPKPPRLANDSFDMPVTANAPSPRSGSPLPHEPTAAQLQRWAPKVDPRKFRSGYIPADTGVTPVEVWYESFPVTDTQTRLTAPDQDDLRVCTDLDRLRTVIATYRRCDFKRKRNIQLVLDWYRDGVPERYTGGPPSNGANGVNFGLAAYAAKERAQHERDFGPDPEPDPEKERRVREYFERRAKAAH